MSSAGTPKAADWHYLFKVFLVLAWVPHFGAGKVGSTSAKILSSLLLLIEMANLCTLRSFWNNEGQKLTALVDKFQASLADGWPHVRKKPNFHYAEHIGAISDLLGPPAYTASWTGEQIIGSLVQTPKNNPSGSLSQIFR